MELYMILTIVGLAMLVVCIVLTTLFFLKGRPILFPLIGMVIAVLLMAGNAAVLPDVVIFAKSEPEETELSESDALKAENQPEPTEEIAESEGEGGEGEEGEEGEEGGLTAEQRAISEAWRHIAGYDPEDYEKSMEELGNISFETSLLSVKLTMPKTRVSGIVDAHTDMKALAKKLGYKKIVLNDDGTVTATLKKKEHKQMVDAIAGEIDLLIQTMQSETYPYVYEISPGKKLDSFTVRVDRQGYETDPEGAEQIPLILYQWSALYQVFSGNAPACTIELYDAKSAEPISTLYFGQAEEAAEEGEGEEAEAKAKE